MPSRRGFIGGFAGSWFSAVAGCQSGNGTPGTSSNPSGTERPTPSAAVDAEKSTTDEPDTMRTGGDRLDWEQTVPGKVPNRPVVHGDLVVVGDESGTVSALSADDGVPRWTYDVDTPIRSVPVPVGDVIVIIAGESDLFDDHEVHGIDAASGDKMWTFSPDDWWLDVIGTRAETVYVATHDDALHGSGETLYALSVDDGSARWSAEVGDNHGGIVTDDTVLVPSSGTVYAIDLDGSPRWTIDVDRYRYKTLAVTGDVVAFVDATALNSPTIRAVDIEAGDELWTFDDWRAHTTRAMDDRLFVGGEQVAEVDPSTGQTEWMADVEGALYDAPIDDGRLYVAGSTTAAIGVSEGKIDWTIDLDAYIVTPAALTEGQLVVQKSESQEDRDRHLIALDATSGDRVWEFVGRESMSDLTTGSGHLYTAEADTVLALEP